MARWWPRNARRAPERGVRALFRRVIVDAQPPRGGQHLQTPQWHVRASQEAGCGSISDLLPLCAGRRLATVVTATKPKLTAIRERPPCGMQSLANPARLAKPCTIAHGFDPAPDKTASHVIPSSFPSAMAPTDHSTTLPARHWCSRTPPPFALAARARKSWS